MLYTPGGGGGGWAKGEGFETKERKRKTKVVANGVASRGGNMSLKVLMMPRLEVCARTKACSVFFCTRREVFRECRAEVKDARQDYNTRVLAVV